MVEIEVVAFGEDVGAAIASAAAELGLSVASDGTLKVYPGSRHWHLRKPGTSGTLEVTHWPAKSRLWVAYHSNRIGDGWVAAAAQQLAAILGSAQ